MPNNTIKTFSVPKFLLNGVFSLGLLAIEAYCLFAIFGQATQLENTQFAMIVHFWTCLVAALLLPKCLKASYQSEKKLAVLFFFSLAFFIPLLGLLGLIAAMIPGLREIKRDRELRVNYTTIRQLTDNHPSSNDGRQVKEAVNLENLLHSHNQAKRMQAVYATLKLDDKVAIPLLRQALRDPVDDIRLLAYALIDRKEQRISARIESTKHNLDNAMTKDVLHHYRSIANDYWEIAHLGLAEGETLNFILSKTQYYLEQGLQLYPQDRGLHFLYAKLLLKTGKLQEAHDEFKIAENLGISKQNLLLYYAEIDFKHRRYPQVKQKMKEIKFTSARPDILASARFWLETPVGS